MLQKPPLEKISERKAQISCFYINATNQIQIICIANFPSLSWKKVVFPGQRLIFDASVEAELEIYNSTNSASILSDAISCQKLKINGNEQK